MNSGSKPSSSMNRKLLALALLAGVGWALYLSADFFLFAFTPAKSGNEESSIIEIYKKENPNEIAKALFDKGIITDQRRFLLLGKLLREWRKLKVGEYKFSPSMTPLQVYGVLASGISVAHPVTVREGENMYEIADDIQMKGLASKERFIELCRDQEFAQQLGLRDPTPPTLEGYLFPDTYFFNRTMSTEDMIRQMVRHFFSTWGKAEQERAQRLGLNRHQVITLASIVEKETGAPQERPLISSVFYNRLKKHIPLQSDPTTIYGIWEHYNGKLHKKDLLAKNDYNTYSIQGLPIGPISNPGKESIQAVLFPSESDYFFFVSHNDGTHEFTRTLAEHSKAVRKFQLDPKAREGKSWRDLSNQLRLEKRKHQQSQVSK